MQIDPNRVKSGKFGRSTKFGQRPCLFHILTTGIKKITKQTVKILMRRPSHLDFHCLQMYVRIYLVSEVTRLYPITYGSRVMSIFTY